MGELLNQEIALDVRHATKYFEVNGGSLRWLHRIRGKPVERRRIIAVDDVTFQVHRGEIFGILGPNGSGKSTLVRLIATLLIPDGGTITVFGYDIQRYERQIKRLINRVSVDAAFFKKLSPLENLMYAARLYGMDGRSARVRSVDILKRVGLDPSTFTEPLEDMSRGMQQKVAIARAFLTAPILLLLDEPTTGLDPRSKREVQAFVRDVRDNHDATILLTTHDMAEAEALCDRIAIIDRGRIVALDTPAGLKRSLPPADRGDITLEDVFMALTGRQLAAEELAA